MMTCIWRNKIEEEKERSSEQSIAAHAPYAGARQLFGPLAATGEDKITEK